MSWPAFAGAGKKVGLEIWRIEKLEPAKWPTDQYGTFYSGDAYIVLNTYEEYGTIAWNLHFWLGKECSQDEQGVAAYATVDLDDQLGGGPVQYREVQGHESQMFLSLFKDAPYNGIKYLDGGIESGFNHVDPDHYDPRLLHIKGKRNTRCMQVEFAAKSLNHGDVFILDQGLKLYQWNGQTANKYEKFAGLKMMNDINDNERGKKAEMIFLDEGVDSQEEKEFFAALGGSPHDVGAETPDDEAKQAPAKLIKISDASGSMQMSQVAINTLERNMLDPDDVFLLDSGSELFVWLGKGATKDEKKKGMEYATEYLNANNKPSWTPISRVVQNAETPVFKSFFKQWDPPQTKASFGKEYKAKEKEADYDVSNLYARQHPEEEKMVDDGSGELTIWRIEDFDKVLTPKDSYGQFYAGDSYVIQYKYQGPKGEDMYMIYFWQGRDSSQDEKGASALLAKELDDSLEGQATQVRVVMNKEPNHFLTLFKGRFVIHEGGRASGFKNRDDSDSYDVDGISLFHVKGTTALNTRAIQVAEKAVSLNSGDCFVLLTPDTMYVWYGGGSNDTEKSCALNIAQLLKENRSVQEVPEGSEPDAFWNALGGKTEYASSSELASEPREPRLFHCSDASGKFTMEEVFNFCQDDLVQEDIFMLDTYTEVWVWVGHDSNKNERDMSFKAAMDFVANAPDGRDPDTPILQVEAGGEPPLFTQAFMGWDYGKAGDFEDPYARALASQPKKVTADSIGYRKFTDTLPLDALQVVDPALNVDNSQRELYLSDADFQQVFGMSKDAFKKLAAWKQKQLKVAKKLF